MMNKVGTSAFVILNSLFDIKIYNLTLLNRIFNAPMKRKILFEFIWLAGCLIAASLLSFGFLNRSALDIELHDTYVVGGGFGQHLTTVPVWFSYFMLLVFWAYLVRAVYFKFKVVLTDIILLVFAGLALYFLSDIMFVVHPPVFRAPNSPELNSTPFIERYYAFTKINYFCDVWVPRLIKIFLILSLAFTGFKTGRNWSKTAKT
jgi:hypothetical protein